MSKRHCQPHVIPLFVVLALLSLAWERPAWAQTADGWSFVITPQVWLSHIAKNGFAAPPTTAMQAGLFLSDEAGNFSQQFLSFDSRPRESIDPQWGIQLAAQKGRLTLAGAFQYVAFKTQNDLRWLSSRTCVPDPDAGPFCISPGQHWADEIVNTTRMDVDLSASYFFPDVVRNWFDASLGLGFKFIHASALREFENLSPVAAFIGGGDFTHHGPGLYTVCKKSDCSDAVPKRRVSEESQIYGATFPMNATMHLTNDAKWLLPFNVTPLIGAEHRNDKNVVYSIDVPPTVFDFPAFGGNITPHVNRLDGTKFAYGVTADLTLRWLITETVSAYAGMRVQYIKGFDTYLAYGPLVGMSVRFGGK